MNVVGPLTKTKSKNKYSWTAIHRGTDWTYAVALSRRSADGVCELLRVTIFQHRKMSALLTDNGEEFLAYRTQSYLNRLGVQHHRTTPYPPQTNGRVEKFDDILTQMLARYTAPD